MKKAFKRFLSRFPSKLPQGVAEFNAWADYIIDAYEVPNNISVRFALATEILHVSPGKVYTPKSYFGTRMLKGAANEIAVAMMKQFKDEQAAKAKAEQEAQNGSEIQVSTN